MDPHLVLETAAIDAVTATVFVELWNDERANPFNAFGRIGQAGEDQVNDVFPARSCSPPGDPNLRSRELESTSIWNRFG